MVEILRTVEKVLSFKIDYSSISGNLETQNFLESSEELIKKVPSESHFVK
jgi:hypothetical protein